MASGRTVQATGDAPDERPSGERPSVEATGQFRRASPRREAPTIEVPDVPCATIEDIVRVYQRPVFRFVTRAGLGDDTEDVVQEVFVALDLNFRGKPIPPSVRGLVFTCAWRKVIDHARDRDRRRRRESDLGEDEVPASVSSLDDNVGRARVALAALARLSHEDQVLVRSGVGESDEHGALVQAAEAMGITEDALRARLKRARQKFTEAIRRVAGKDAGEDQ